jgi:hypothetical protein
MKTTMPCWIGTKQRNLKFKIKWPNDFFLKINLEIIMPSHSHIGC